MLQHWTDREEIALYQAKTVHDLRHIAIAVLERMAGEISMVCGPISTGGKGSKKENLKIFEKTVEVAVRKGYKVFNQLIFEEPMERMRPKNRYHYEVLDYFYRPIFASGHISNGLFISGWEKSFGSVKEYSYTKEFDVKVILLEPDFHLLR